MRIPGTLILFCLALLAGCRHSYVIRDGEARRAHPRRRERPGLLRQDRRRREPLRRAQDHDGPQRRGGQVRTEKSKIREHRPASVPQSEQEEAVTRMRAASSLQLPLARTKSLMSGCFVISGTTSCCGQHRVAGLSKHTTNIPRPWRTGYEVTPGPSPLCASASCRSSL